MLNVLITAFEPYDEWEANASWLALRETTKNLANLHQITTRLYPVDFPQVKERLLTDLADEYDIAIHMGQAPGSTGLRLESMGLNIGGNSKQLPEDFAPLVADGPQAYRSKLPLASWARQLRREGIPTQVSYHAGTFLCNATLYLTHHLCHQHAWKTKATFLHLPLDPSQVMESRNQLPTLPAHVAATGLRLILQQLLSNGS